MKHCYKLLALILCICSFTMMSTVAFAADDVTASMSASEITEGNTVTLTISMSGATVSSIGVTVTADVAYEIVSAKWLQNGTIANYDASKNKGAFAPGSATEISGKIFEINLKAKTPSSAKKAVSVAVIAKNGATVVFEKTVTADAKIVCKAHTFGAYTPSASNHSRKCSTCGYTETANHSWDEGKITSDATCGKPGVKTYTCKYCSHTKTEPVAQLSHSWDSGKVTTAPTCTKEGVKTFTCTLCSATKTEVIAKIAHTYGSWTKVNDSTHQKKCTCGDTVTVNHNWDEGRITSQSTCGQPGTKTYTCTDCKATKSETVNKLDHTYTNACDNTCNICSATRETSHKYSSTYSSDATNHWFECSVCKDRRNVVAHTNSDWIIDQEATIAANGSKHIECTICRRTLQTESIPKLDCKHPNSKIDGIVGATCTEDGYTGDSICNECGAVLEEGKTIPATGHDYEVTGQRDATCTVVGYEGDKTCKVCHDFVKGKEIPKTEHVYIDGKCKCGATQSEESKAPEESVDNDISYDNTIVEKKNPLSIIGIVFGVIVAVVALGAGVFFFVKKQSDSEDDDETEPANHE